MRATSWDSCPTPSAPWIPCSGPTTVSASSNRCWRGSRHDWNRNDEDDQMTNRHSQSQPSQNEDEYFVRQDAELIKKMRTDLDQQRQQQERKAHYMKCPKCGADLQEETMDQAKVDVCRECHGVW